MTDYFKGMREEIEEILSDNEMIIEKSQKNEKQLDKLSKLLKVQKHQVKDTIQNLVNKIKENEKEIEKIKDPNYEPYKFDVKSNVVTEDGVWIFSAKVNGVKKRRFKRTKRNSIND
jgi:alanyl-tRNA synthetase